MMLLSPPSPVTDAGTALWTGFFTSPMQTAGRAHPALVQGAYAGVFLMAAVVCALQSIGRARLSPGRNPWRHSSISATAMSDEVQR